MKTISIIFIILGFSSQCFAQEKNIFSLSHDVRTYASMPSEFGTMNAYNKTDNVAKDSVCDCKPNLALEIGVTSILWGMPTFWAWRGLSDRDTNVYLDPRSMLIIPSAILLMFTLGPIAEWTSGCEVSYWHAVWIGWATPVIPALIYYGVYGEKHPHNIYKFYLPEYLAIGVVPSIATILIFNQFLHPNEKQNQSQSLFIFPSIGRENQACLNVVGRF